MSTPLNQNEGTIISNPPVLDVENSQLKNKFSTSFHNLDPSMGQALLKEVPKLKEWPHFSGEGEYDHISAHRWYIKLRQAHAHQSWTWWKIQIINKWANDSWKFKVEKAFESSKFNAEKDRALPWFGKQKNRLTALYPDMSKFMICRKISRKCGGDLEISIKSRNSEKSLAEDIINILEEVTTRTRIGSSRVSKLSPVNLKLEKFNSEQLSEAEISLHLNDKQESELSIPLYDHKEAFASDKEPLGAIVGHEADIIPNIERAYPPPLRRTAYPATPKFREAQELHIRELLDLGVIRKAGHNEEVEITTPVKVAWHNVKCRMVWDFRALNTYTVPDRYPIPKIQISLTKISQEVYISTMDGLKGFHKIVVTPRAKNKLRIIVHCGVTWEEHIYRLFRVVGKIQSVNMKVSSKKWHFGFKELKALGDVVSGLSLGIDKNKVAAVLLKPMPQNKKKIQ
ncbi:hypothetical protein O181_014112 [Austropuccinia psidii MF-1]|uniref:Reverse transcriptase domain-containing protein n=1 Tax=Austropuccinia psidii MF-1 TaxID=1389203 RepID=A0A9Q3BZK7_9BASI|nr:hypothetical protein [Austropuccinia psidii MF-1]